MNYKELLGIPITIKNHKIIPYEFLTIPKKSYELLGILRNPSELVRITWDYELLRIPMDY